ncbi:transglycosylase SLT domain-containing protein [Pararoseomonas indoligenes]|uniref:transglycosylase SLT domain-containing protein n=1 Tax=Roseomonas indoligenes TaxID=2820811 RepID=UPI0031597F22
MRLGPVTDSGERAIGAMQLMPDTARRLGVNANDVADNIRGGVSLLADLFKKYGQDPGLAGGAYFAGEGRIDRYLSGRATLGPKTFDYMRAAAGPGDLGGLNTRRSADVISIGRAEEMTRGTDGRSDTQARLNSQIRTLEDAAGRPGLDSDAVKRYREEAEKLRAQLVGLNDPLEELRRRGVLAAQANLQQEGAARQLLTTEQQAAEQARGQGKSAAEQIMAGLEARRQAQAGLDTALRDQIETTKRAADADRDAASVAQGGTQAINDRLTRRQAETDALKFAEAGTDKYRDAVDRLVDSQKDRRAAEADLGTANLIAQQRDSIELLEQETKLIGLSAEARKTELDILRERQRVINAGGDPNSSASMASQNNIRRIADLTARNGQLKASMDELASVGEQAFDRIGSAITEAFTTGKTSALNFGSIAKGVLSETVQAALRLAIINPLMNSLFGGSRGTLGGIMTVMGGGASGAGALAAGAGMVIGGQSGGGSAGTYVPVQNQNGTVIGYAQQAQQAYSLYDKFGGMNPGNYMSAGHVWNTGSSWADSALNASLWGTSGATQLAGTNAALAANASAYSATGAGVGFGPATAAEVAASGGSAAGVSGMTVGGAAAGVAGIAGGAYGIYSGIQKGGVGGASMAAGGAAVTGMSAAAMAGMAVPVYGWIAAAVLMILGSILPGQKPSDMTGTATMSTLDNNLTVGGLSGKRMSQENRDSASAIARSIDSMASKIGPLAGLTQDVAAAYTVSVGNRDGVKVDGLDGGRLSYAGKLDEEMSKTVMNDATTRLLQMAATQTPDDNVRKVINASGAGNPETALANLDWYQNTYKTLMKDAEDQTTAYAQSVKSVNDQWQPLIDKAASLGLAFDPIMDKMTDALKKLDDERHDAFNDNINGMRNAISGYRGDDARGVALKQFDLQRDKDRKAGIEQIEQAGFGEAELKIFKDTFDTMKELERKTVELTATRAQEDRNSSRAATLDSINLERMSLSGLGDTAAYEQARLQLTANIVTLKRSLEDLGVSSTTVADTVRAANDNMATSLKRLAEDQKIATDSTNGALVDRYQTAMGTADDLGNQLARLERQHAAERIQMARQEGVDLAQLMVTQAAERSALVKAEQQKILATGKDIRAYLDHLNTTASAGRSPEQAYQSASLLFERDISLANSGDADALSRITGTADTLLTAANDMYSSSEQFSSVQDYVKASLANLKETKSYDAQILDQLKAAGAADIAQKLALDNIATRAGGEAGARAFPAYSDAYPELAR